MSFAGLKGFMRLLDESPSRILVFGLPSVSTLYVVKKLRPMLDVIELCFAQLGVFGTGSGKADCTSESQPEPPIEAPAPGRRARLAPWNDMENQVSSSISHEPPFYTWRSAAPMLFPMHTVTADVLMKMTEVEPHEKLKARGELVVFSDDLGRAAFVSHQWLDRYHPDPEFKQMRILQLALKRMLNSAGSVSLDFVTESLVQSARPLPMREFQLQTLYLWYDYFSCPQLERQIEITDTLQQANAIMSIPAYIAKCRFFFALCPVLDCPSEGAVLGTATWSRRGWCRLERAARELSPNSTWILIQSETSIEVVGTALSLPSGSVGEGDLTITEDRQKLAPVMRQILVQKLNHCLRVGDLPGFRRHLNLQSVHLRGLEIEPVTGLLPSCQAHGGDEVVAEFLHQNGLRRVGEADSAGWWPLHYAALSGDAEVLRALMQQLADVNRLTSKDEPMLGFPPWVSALTLAVFFRHHEAAQLLLKARARPEGGGGLLLSVHAAAYSDSAEGVRLLCAAGARPLARNIVGVSSLQIAASLGAPAALEELVTQGRPGLLDLSRALVAATSFRDGSTGLVQRLIALRADMDFQLNTARDYSTLGRLLFAGKSLQHQLGTATVLTTTAYHMNGSTALMLAIRSGQFEAAAALIVAGARLDLCNCRNWTAVDFARGQSLPRFLQLGLEGDRSECRRVSSLALLDGYVEIAF
ncbi:ANK2 [Symbiodinium microadriaticum]|nr:ANK2 [Symbiodinium microadriaticum]